MAKRVFGEFRSILRELKSKLDYKSIVICLYADMFKYTDILLYN